MGPLREGGRVDFARLRQDRRHRLLASMEAEGVDVLLLGRPSNIAFASGARLLWTAGHRPFSVGCVVVRRTGRIHLLSTWDEGVPEEIGREELFGLSWNPSIAAARLGQVDGTAGAAVLATDGWSPGAQTVIDAVFAGATLTDAGPLLRRVRGPKSEDELTCIRVAASLAEAVLSVVVAALRPGISSRELIGIYAEAASSLGSASLPSEAVIWVAARDEEGGDGRRAWADRLPSERRLEAGELVAINPGAFYGGYEGVLGRSLAVGAVAGGPPIELRSRCRAALDATIATCRPGATGADLLRAWRAASGAEAPAVLARGVGLGAEPPVMGRDTGHSEVLDEGVVLAVGGALPVAGSPPGSLGGVFEQDMILVGADGPTVLTRYASELGGSKSGGRPVLG
jgi:Xaa-Pro dipeptidase